MKLSALVLAALATLSPQGAGEANSPGKLQLVFGSRGLERVSYAGEVLEDVHDHPEDEFHIWHMAARDRSGRPLSAPQYGWGENKQERRWDAASKSWTYRFSWGSIRTQYVQVGDRLDVHVTEENRADSGVFFEGAVVYPLVLRLPLTPKGFGLEASVLATNASAPGATLADYGSGLVAAVTPTDSKPLFSGFEVVHATSASGGQRPAYAVIVSGTRPDSFKEVPQLPRPAIAPGGLDTFTLSVRFAPSGTSLTDIAGDALRRWALGWPATLNWPDRRIIGTVYLADSPHGERTQPGGDGAPDRRNPRRYFPRQLVDGLDIRNSDGVARFQQRLLANAAATVRNLKRLNAQGVITWDIEGEEYPQDTSYVCSPDQIDVAAPEMETVVRDAVSPYRNMKLDDAYFRVIRNAGFRVGVCVRPQQFIKEADGHGLQQSLPPERVAAQLIRKMRYAHDRWGATIFYLDSTVAADGSTLDASVIEQAAAALPDSLLIPEESTLRMYRASAPFQTFLFHGDMGTSAMTRAIYPGAFSVNLINDVDAGKLNDVRTALTEAVRHGDILMVHADYWHPNNDAVVDIYKRAAQGPH